MNEIVNTFLLAGDKCMPELHLRHQDLLIVLVDYLLNTVKTIILIKNTVIKTL